MDKKTSFLRLHALDSTGGGVQVIILKNKITTLLEVRTQNLPPRKTQWSKIIHNPTIPITDHLRNPDTDYRLITDEEANRRVSDKTGAKILSKKIDF